MTSKSKLSESLSHLPPTKESYHLYDVFSGLSVKHSEDVTNTISEKSADDNLNEHSSSINGNELINTIGTYHLHDIFSVCLNESKSIIATEETHIHHTINPNKKFNPTIPTKSFTHDIKHTSEITGTTAGIIGSAENYSDNVVLSAIRGHGFAAEKANHLNDLLAGKDAKIIGCDNAKNGADRLVNGVNIQTKYCKTGSKCISECFEDGYLKYINTDGSPMQIEVPSDKYDSAIQAMENRIKDGQVPGVTDPSKAKDIVRKGAFTYEQVLNVAKFGTVESLTYDAINGISLSASAMGISSAVSFAVSIWNGSAWEDALEGACYTGLKVGGVAWLSSIITAQLGRTGIEQGLRGTTDWVVNQMGPQAAAWIANGLRTGNSIYGAAAMNNVSKLLRGNLVTGVVTTIVISSVDFSRMFQGKISGAQLFKSVTTTASSVAGGSGGMWAGAVGGAAVGSAVPIIGTAVGGFIGGLLGSIVGGTAASKVASSVLDEFIEDDAKKMLVIVEKIFGDLSFDYLLNEGEAKEAIDEFQKNDIQDFLRNMYASDSRKKFAKKMLTPIIAEVVKKREVISLPTQKEIIKTTESVIKSLATSS